MDKKTRISFLVYMCVWYFCGVNILAQNDYGLQDDSKIQNKSDSEEESVCKQMTGTAADLLEKKFRSIGCEELGLTALDSVFESLPPGVATRGDVDDDDLVSAISNRLMTKLDSGVQILEEMKRNIRNDPTTPSFVFPCSSNSARVTQYESIEINSKKVTLNIPKNTCKVCVKNLLKKYNLKVETQYFMSVNDGATNRECNVRPGARKLFHETLQPASKTVILLVDTSTSLKDHPTSIVKEVLSLLGPRDFVGLISLSHSTSMVSFTDDCGQNNYFIGHPTSRNKEVLLKRLNSAEVGNKSFNISSALESVWDVLKTQTTSENIMIIFIGRKSSLIPEAKYFLNILANMKMNFSNLIMSGCNIQTIDSTNFHSSTDDEEHNLENTSDRWFVDLNSTTTVQQIASLLLLKMPFEPVTVNVNVAPPVWDPKRKHSASPFLLPLYSPLHPLGLIVIELYLSDIAEDIVYFNSFSMSHRAFMIDFSGNVIVHSSYPRPELITTEPELINISKIETDKQFEQVLFEMLRNSSGKIKYSSDTYTWKWVKNIFIVCVVSQDTAIKRMGRNIGSGVVRDLQHHRMDLLPPPNAPLCRHFLTVSTIHKGTLYLSPSSFQSPFSYLFDLNDGKDVSLTLMQSYMAYLKDTTRLLSNPGLKPDVRTDVGILNGMLSYFKEQHIRGAYNKYIVRRYAASEHGVMVLFPGTILESDFEPNRKSWFLWALRNPGNIILTPPYLDIGGAGYIVTISQSPARTTGPAIVLAVDMTMRYLYKMLLDALPFCADVNVKCFLMDDKGYLLSHPGLVDPSNAGPMEQTHITHEESLIANDMLNHKGFVVKKLCKNYADSTLQRYYQFNTSLDRILTNIVHGEHCARYHIAAVPGTNIFVGTVNSTCNLGAFCPCSVVDRLCLNCNRMEQNECECPCECPPTEEVSCDASSSSPVPICEFELERNRRNNYYTRRYNLAPHLDSCFDFQCESYGCRSSCLGVLGCEWCELGRDGESLLSAPFCTAQPTCFGGVLGAPTPYEAGSLGQVSQDDVSPAYSAVGPVVGCVVALCLILASAVYCYKQNLSTAESLEPFSPPGETWPHNGVRMSRLNSEDDVRDERSGHRDKLLLSGEVAAPVSPYRILTGYRRPNTAGESDHGYSTMTPHEESEHRAFALVEPFLTQEGEGGGGASSPALSTPRSSAVDLPITVLPCGKNNVLAPVTVHRHMEAT